MAYASQAGGDGPAPSASDVGPAAAPALAEEDSHDPPPVDAGEPNAQESPVADDHAPDTTVAHDDTDGFDIADLDNLVEAPSHAQDIEQKIKAAFPGTEFALLSDPAESQEGQDE